MPTIDGHEITLTPRGNASYWNSLLPMIVRRAHGPFRQLTVLDMAHVVVIANRTCAVAMGRSTTPPSHFCGGGCAGGGSHPRAFGTPPNMWTISSIDRPLVPADHILDCSRTDDSPTNALAGNLTYRTVAFRIACYPRAFHIWGTFEVDETTYRWKPSTLNLKVVCAHSFQEPARKVGIYDMDGFGGT